MKKIKSGNQLNKPDHNSLWLIISSFDNIPFLKQLKRIIPKDKKIG